MILVAVTIKAVNGDQIIVKANDATTRYSDEATKENGTITNYINLIDSFWPQQGEYPIKLYMNGDSSITRENFMSSNYEDYATLTLLAPSGNQNNCEFEMLSKNSKNNIVQNKYKGTYTIDEQNNFTITYIKIDSHGQEETSKIYGLVILKNGKKGIGCEIFNQMVLFSDENFSEMFDKVTLTGVYTVNKEGSMGVITYSIEFNGENQCTINGTQGTFVLYDNIMVCTVDDGEKVNNYVLNVTFDESNNISTIEFL